MGDPIFTDEELMAYADGELPEDRASELDLALVEDTELAERLAMFAETRSLSKEALQPMLDEPVPDHLLQRVKDLAAQSEQSGAEQPAADNNVVAFPKSTEAPRTPLWQLPIAAGIALAIGIGVGLFLRPEATPTSGLQVAALNDQAIVGALATVASGEELMLDNGSRFTAIATFRDASETLCREFEYDQAAGSTVVSVACHDGQAWDVKLAIAAAPSSDTNYAPASSLETLDAYLSATGAGAPIIGDDEAAALAGLR